MCYISSNPVDQKNGKEKKKKDQNLSPKNDRKVQKKWYNRKIRSKKLESEK